MGGWQVSTASAVASFVFYGLAVIWRTRVKRHAPGAQSVPELDQIGNRRFRNGADHIDNYALDSGREQSVCRRYRLALTGRRTEKQ